MRQYEYILILSDDIVVAKGQIEAANDTELERVLKHDICPQYVWDRLTYKEVFIDDQI